MENLKVKVTTEQESKEVQELFFELGFEWFGSKREVHEKRVGLFFTTKVVGVDCLTYDKDHEFDLVNHKELTIPQLRDLVVLKRNDKNDATHSTDGESGLAIMLGGVWYGYNFNEKKWESWVDDDDYKLKDLKPIEKKMTETEYLMQGKNGERLMESVGQLSSGKGVCAFVVDGEEKHSHYRKSVKHLDFIDPYRIAQLYDLHPCADHIAKKALCTGKRGHKDLIRDIQDIIDTAERWKQMIQEDQNAI